MRNALTAFITAGLVALTGAFTPLATPTFANTCSDVELIFARGSGQSLGAAEATAFRQEIIKQLNAKKSSLNFSFYELGSEEKSGDRYPAIALDFWTTIGAKVSSGAAYAYGESVKQGIAELKTHLNAMAKSCPGTKFVLGGYSQGAQVITSALPDLAPEKIIFAAAFGDPKLYLPEGEGLLPPACLGQSLSDYRIYVPNCYTAAGSLGALKPYRPDNWAGKLGLWCTDKDLVCGAGLRVKKSEDGDNLAEQLFNGTISAHTAYESSGVIASAAKTIAGKIAAAFSRRVSAPAAVFENRDTAVLVDAKINTLGIGKYYDFARKFALNLMTAGNKVSLYSYNDPESTGAATLRYPAGTVFSNYEKDLNSITHSVRGESAETSVASALLSVMSQENWHTDAVKSLILITDTEYDGAGIKDVVARSLEIDPVNIYVVTPDTIQDSYATLTGLTNGATFLPADYAAASVLISSRPGTNFPLAEYTATPGETVTFSANASGIKYEWDLDFDGVFETETASPIVSKTYPVAAEGYVQLRVTDINGYVSTASAKVSIANPSDYRIYHLSDFIDLSAFSEEEAAGYGQAEAMPAPTSTSATPAKSSTAVKSATDANNTAASANTPIVPKAPNSGRR